MLFCVAFLILCVREYGTREREHIGQEEGKFEEGDGQMKICCIDKMTNEIVFSLHTWGEKNKTTKT